MSEKNNSDIEALILHFQARHGLIVRVAFRYAPCPDLAYDIVQQVFIDFVHFVNVRNWDPSQDSTGILYRLTRDRALAVWRNYQKHSTKGVLKIADRLIAASRNDQGETPERLDEMNDEFQALHGCIEQLPAQSRNLLERHYYHKVPIKTLAEELSARPGTIRQIFTRIRRKLKLCIEKRVKKENGKPSHDG